MNKNLHSKYKELTYDEDTVSLYAELMQQDILNVKVLFYIARCEQSNTQVTVKSIADNVTNSRRIGVKDETNTLVSFAKKDAPIDRKTAEKIVERLSYASLVYFDVQLPFKFIKLTSRGVQVAIKIRKNTTGGN